MKSKRIERWACLLSEYRLDIKYVKGTEHNDVDCLSRAPVGSPDEGLERCVFLVLPVDTDEWIGEYTDEESMNLLNNPQDTYVLDGVIYNKDKQLYVPVKFRSGFINAAHDSHLAGHGGVKATIENLMKDYWWPTLANERLRSSL